MKKANQSSVYAHVCHVGVCVCVSVSVNVCGNRFDFVFRGTRDHFSQASPEHPSVGLSLTQSHVQSRLGRVPGVNVRASEPKSDAFREDL